MKKALLYLFIALSAAGALQAANNSENLDELRRFVFKKDIDSAAMALQKILSTENLPDIRAWIQCGDIYFERRRYFSSLLFYKYSHSNLIFLSDIIDVKEIGLNEKAISDLVQYKIKKNLEALELPPGTKVFSDSAELEMPDSEFYRYLAKTVMVENEDVDSLLPVRYVISELYSLIEAHLEEYADILFEQGLEEEYSEEVKPELYDFTQVDVDPYIDLTEIHSRLEYPPKAREKGIEGVVIVNVLVDYQGEPIKCDIIKSDNKILNDAAKNAVMKSKFKPALIDNQPVFCWIDLPIVFKLN